MRLIDADELKEDLKPPEESGRMGELLGMVINAIIDNAPTIEPEQRWIPCSERLPEKPNMYTVTDIKGNVVRFIFDNTESSREYWLRCAKAWTPLPEPYREG